MMMLREETRALMMQCRRSMSSRATAMTGMPKVATAQKASPIVPQQQQRQHLNVTPTPSATPHSPSVVAGLKGQVLEQQEVQAATPTAHTLVRCQPINNGKQVVLEFSDESRYEVHSSWLKDSSPTCRGADFYRTSAADVWKLRDFVVTDAKPSGDGEQLSLKYDAKGVEHSDVFEARWLHAFAPFVGKPLHGGAAVKPPVRGTASLLDNLRKTQTPWVSDVEMPEFDAKTLAGSVDMQVDFIENMISRGIALVTGVGKPGSFEREDVGKGMGDLVFDIMGKFNQHPVRSTSYGVMRKTAESAKQGADYDMQNPLSMHTDHTVYQGTPGYLQFLYQAEGSVRSKVCDGLALAEYLRVNHAEHFEILTTVQMTHSSRNTLYTAKGAPRNVYDKTTDPAAFELVHTHPVIVLDKNGVVEQVVQSETKRGVSALPYERYEKFMEAYELWTQLCEDDRFIKHFDWPEGTMVVTNNWRTLHGRASVRPEVARTMVFAYVNKIQLENRYRLLKQMQTERQLPSMDDRWLTRIPNQVLEGLVV